MTKLGYETDLKKFLKSCATRDCEVNPDDFTKNMKEQVDEVIKQIARLIDTGENFKTSADAQGSVVLLVTRLIGIGIGQAFST